MQYIAIAFGVLSFVFALSAPVGAVGESPLLPLEIDGWREILATRVNGSGRVAYRTMAELDGDRLGKLRRSLAEAKLASRTRDERVAFWINAYNAAVIEVVLRGARPDDLRSRARFYSWFDVEIAGRSRTLDGIEAELDRYIVADPRIRFALCKGALGAPALSPEPLAAKTLDAQLADAARRFLGDETRNRLTADPPALSMMFEWHRSEFEGVAGSLGAYLAPFARASTRKTLLGPPPAEPFFLPFDWHLNAAPREEPVPPKQR